MENLLRPTCRLSQQDFQPDNVSTTVTTRATGMEALRGALTPYGDGAGVALEPYEAAIKQCPK